MFRVLSSVLRVFGLVFKFITNLILKKYPSVKWIVVNQTMVIYQTGIGPVFNKLTEFYSVFVFKCEKYNKVRILRDLNVQAFISRTQTGS